MTEKRTPVDGSPEDDDDIVVTEPVVADAEEVPAPEGDEGLTVDDLVDAGDAEPHVEPEPEDIHPADLHALAALALGIEPSAHDPDIHPLIAASPTLQEELATLLPLADILTSLYRAQPDAPAGATQVAAPTATPTERTRPAVADRRARATTAPAERPVVAREPGRPLSIGRFSLTSVALVALGVVAALAVLWALALLDRVNQRDDEIAALKEQVVQLRQAANASAFVLTPSSDEAPGAGGTIFYSIADRTVLLDVSGLPELDDDEVYQIWFQGDDDEWVLGPAFRVNSQGESVQRLAGDTPGFTRVAISREPGPGSQEPSGDFLLEGTLAGGNG